MLGCSQLEFAIAVDFAAGRKAVFDGVGVVVAAAAAVECAAAVVSVEHCDVLAGVSVVAVADEIALVADGDACEQEQEHLNPYLGSCRTGRRIGCNFVGVAVGSTMFEYSIVAEAAVVAAG